ncbi:MAG: replication protein [Bacillales bacterium]
MPWAKMTRKRIMTVYKELFNKIVMRERDVDLTVKEVLIRTEILKRDFSKRQLSILSLIMTFSYFYGKDSAIIPKLKDFSLAGVSQTKITGELTKLVDMGVITWNRGKDTNEFAINDPTEWRTPYHSTYDDIRSRELFFLNLRHAGIPFDIDALMQKVMADDDV